jgi:hypothetical protein
LPLCSKTNGVDSGVEVSSGNTEYTISGCFFKKVDNDFVTLTGPGISQKLDVTVREWLPVRR